MPRPRVRTPLILLLLLIGGAIINVAVAWGCNSFLSPIDLESPDHPPTVSELNRFNSVGDQVGQDESLGRIGYCAFGVRRTMVFTLSNPPHRVRKCVYLYDVGWPLYTLAGEEWTDAHSARSQTNFLRRRVEWRNSDGRLVRQSLALPSRPIWPGFAVNALFYALVLKLLFAGPGSLRRALRRRRGLCPACAYPMGASPVCTECGKPVRSKGVETAS